MDNESEAIFNEFEKRAYENEVTFDYSRPGMPTENPFIEPFNDSLEISV